MAVVLLVQSPIRSVVPNSVRQTLVTTCGNVRFKAASARVIRTFCECAPARRVTIDRNSTRSTCSSDAHAAGVCARTQRGTCTPILNGIGSDKLLTVDPLLAVHPATW